MKSSHQDSVNLQDFLNEHPFSLFQWGIFFMCFLVALFDGYDTVAIGYIAPSLIDDWGIAKPDLATAMSAGLLGIAIGAISFGPLADKIGRKKMLISAVTIFALGTIASAFVTNLLQLEILRFITGVGLGAAMPNAVTLLSEYCPEKRRFFLVNTMFCGFPVGAALGGFIAAWIIPTFGWHSVLLVGGIGPLILVIFMLIFLPESARYLVNKSLPTAIITRIMFKISKTARNIGAYYLVESQAQPQEKGKSGIAVILSPHYILGSVLLWITYFMGLVIFYGVSNWMPTLFREADIPASLASIVTGLFALGGLGAIANGWLMDRYNPSLLIAGFSFLTSFTVALIGYTAGISIPLLIAITIIAGIVMNTAQSSLASFAASFYPTSGRTTGVSWMLGIGRFGGIAGSFLVAQLIKWDLSLTTIFIVLSVPSIIATLSLLIIYFKYYHNPKVGKDSTPNEDKELIFTN